MIRGAQYLSVHARQNLIQLLTDMTKYEIHLELFKGALTGLLADSELKGDRDYFSRTAMDYADGALKAYAERWPELHLDV